MCFQGNAIMRKVYKSVFAVVTVAVILTCSACAVIPAADPAEEPDAEKALTETAEEIRIPASIFRFANTDIEDNMDEFGDYCTGVRRDGDDLIIEVTPSQKEELMEMYAGSIDDVLKDMAEEEQGYYVETDKDHSCFVYHYDEKIDGILEAKMLLMITTSDVLTGIMETGDPDWNARAKIVNCHTGLTVGEGTFPDGSITFGPDEWQASYDDGAWLRARQEEVMTMAGLTGAYEKLTDTQKGIVTSIGQMLDWIEGKYQQKFQYISYAPGDAIEQEHLKVYPEQGDESDVVTVYRTYENGLYRYEDDYGAILMRPAYEEQVRTFAEQYLPSEGIKIYTEIKNGGSGAADEETVLNEVSAATYIFMDDALCSGQYETFLEAVPDWLAENCQGVPAGIYLRMTESEAWQQIDRSNYEDKLREDIYTGEAECAISGSGKVTVY